MNITEKIQKFKFHGGVITGVEPLETDHRDLDHQIDRVCSGLLSSECLYADGVIDLGAFTDDKRLDRVRVVYSRGVPLISRDGSPARIRESPSLDSGVRLEGALVMCTDYNSLNKYLTVLGIVEGSDQIIRNTLVSIDRGRIGYNFHHNFEKDPDKQDGKRYRRSFAGKMRFSTGRGDISTNIEMRYNPHKIKFYAVKLGEMKK